MEDLRVGTLVADQIATNGIIVRASDGIERIAMTTTEDGDAMILVKDLTGTPRMTFSVDRGGTASVAMYGRDGTPKVVFTLDGDDLSLGAGAAEGIRLYPLDANEE